MRIYLDNSVIGRLLDIDRGIQSLNRMLEEDMAVLPDLFKACVQKDIQFCASDDAGAEIEKLRHRRPELTDALMAKLQSFTLVPIRHATRYNDGHHYGMGATYAGNSPRKVDLLAQELNDFLLRKTRITKDAKREAIKWDAYHLAVCKDTGCDIFLTCDYASIWKYREPLKLFGIEVKRPLELSKELQNTDSSALP